MGITITVCLDKGRRGRELAEDVVIREGLIEKKKFVVTKSITSWQDLVTDKSGRKKSGAPFKTLTPGGKMRQKEGVCDLCTKKRVLWGQEE